MLVMGSSLEWTPVFPRWQRPTIRLSGTCISLENLYNPACPHRTLRQMEEEEEQ
uniref:Uncharacterized protein n=2 Tax=gambiae species complex TaxID=44542 RepID=A0A453YZ84_ANOGA